MCGRLDGFIYNFCYLCRWQSPPWTLCLNTSYKWQNAASAPSCLPSTTHTLVSQAQHQESRSQSLLTNQRLCSTETESSLTRVRSRQPQTEAQPQWEHQRNSNITGSLSSECSSVDSNTEDIYQNEHTPGVSFTRTASNLSVSALHEELQGVLKSRQWDDSSISEQSEWEN